MRLGELSQTEARLIRAFRAARPLAREIILTLCETEAHYQHGSGDEFTTTEAEAANIVSFDAARRDK